MSMYSLGLCFLMNDLRIREMGYTSGDTIHTPIRVMAPRSDNVISFDPGALAHLQVVDTQQGR